MGIPILECKDIEFGYEGIPILGGISLSVSTGDLVGVIGPNGAGKTTLIKVLSGLIAPAVGTVELNGQNMAAVSRQEIARELAVVTQDASPDFGFTVREEVMLGRSPHHGGLHFDAGPDRSIVRDAMERTGVAHLSDRNAASLSGGERQRVRIARGLAQQPQVLLMDEPTNHLDLYSQLSLAELMRDINRQGLAIILVSHDIDFVAGSCDRINILDQGRFRFTGSPEAVITEENLAAAFGISALVDTNPATGRPRMTPIGRLRPHD
jgi:ABC-type cobalamin/Fe3+-siderophores transport system ATPase subunit